MSEEIIEAKEIAQPNPFSDSAWATTPPTVQEPIQEEITAEDDPVIKEKDEKIKEEKPVSDKPDEPLKIPGATPPPVQDLPDDKKKLPKDEPFEFANEASKKLYTAFKEGKNEEVLKYLSEQQTLEKLDELKPIDAIKLSLAYKNKDYTPQEIDDLFVEQYQMPEKPEQLLEESDEEFAAREATFVRQQERMERRLARDSKDAKTELNKYKQELVLPNIPQDPIEQQEPTKEELVAIEKQRDYFLQTANESLSKLTDYKATFKDQEVEIPIVIGVTDKEKEDLKPLLDSLNTDLPQFFTQLNWLDKDGKLNTDKVVNDLHLLQNRDNVIPKLVNEAGNKRYAEAVKSQKNVDFSGQQRKGNLNPSVQEEVDKKVRGFLAAT